MKCPQCGAGVQLAADTTRADCPYCNTTVAAPAAASDDPLGALFADRNGNGIPDVLEKLGQAEGRVSASVTVTRNVAQRYVVNGVSYDSLEAMPADARRLLEGLPLPLQPPVVAPAPAPGTGGPRAVPPPILWFVVGAFLAGLVAWLMLSLF